MRVLHLGHLSNAKQGWQVLHLAEGIVELFGCFHDSRTACSVHSVEAIYPPHMLRYRVHQECRAIEPRNETVLRLCIYNQVDCSRR